MKLRLLLPFYGLVCPLDLRWMVLIVGFAVYLASTILTPLFGGGVSSMRRARGGGVGPQMRSV
jgi:hypothetical protein